MREQELLDVRDDVVARLDVGRVGRPAKDGVEMTARGAVCRLPARSRPTQSLRIEPDPHAIANPNEAGLKRIRSHPPSIPAGEQRPRRSVADNRTEDVLNSDPKWQYARAIDFCRRCHTDHRTELDAGARGHGKVRDIHGRKLTRSGSGLVAERDKRPRHEIKPASRVQRTENGQNLLICDGVGTTPGALCSGPYSVQRIARKSANHSEVPSKRTQLVDVVPARASFPRSAPVTREVLKSDDITVDVDDRYVRHLGRSAVGAREPALELAGFIHVLVDRAIPKPGDLEPGFDAIEHTHQQHGRPPWLAPKESLLRSPEPRPDTHFVKTLRKPQFLARGAIDGSTLSPRQQDMDQARSEWSEAVTLATMAMSDQGARERRRHSRLYAEWCAARGMEPAVSAAGDVRSYVHALDGRRQLRAKARCSLRAVFRTIDRARAARVAGLGNQTSHLARYDGTPLGALLGSFVNAKPGRRGVRKASITRLLAWCAEVGLELPDVLSGDLYQFGEWLREVGSLRRETLGLARELISMRWSREGRRILGEAEPEAPLLSIELEAPMRPRFNLSDALRNAAS